jgi:hypothetical protein
MIGSSAAQICRVVSTDGGGMVKCTTGSTPEYWSAQY